MNKKFLLLAGVLSVLSVNGLTVYADSTVSTNSENLFGEYEYECGWFYEL